MSRRAFPIMLSSEEQSQLQAWAKARSQPHRLVQRAQIILLAAHGMESQQIARRLPVSRPTVQLWRQRFLALRTAGLEKDAPRPGRLPRIPADKIRAIVAATVRSKPPNATHGSTRTMARTQGVSEATVRRIGKQYHLKPHRTETFQLGRSPVRRETHRPGRPVLEPTGKGPGAGGGREEPNPGAGPDPTWFADEARALRHPDAGLQTPRNHDVVRGLESARRGRPRGLYAPAPTPGIHPISEASRRPDTPRIELALDRGQLRHAPAPARAVVAATPSPFSPALHAHFLLLAGPRGALVSGTDREADSSGFLS